MSKRQQLLSSPLEGGRSVITHPFIHSPHFREDMFLEGNHTCPRLRSGERLKFLNIKTIGQ